MHPIFKITFGAILLVASIWYMYVSASAQQALVTVIKGVVPPFVALVGVFVIWLELDELKIEGETKSEKAAKKPRKK
jgi:hypothetical protein